jgi:hypothetical protein
MIPFVKTNGVWGTNEELRHRILHDFANIAYRQNKLMSMDISVDAFHNNNNAVVRILNDVVRSDYLAPAVRISLLGLNDTKSYATFMCLIDELRASGLDVEIGNNGSFALWVPHVRGVSVYYDFGAYINKIGRAAKNNLGQIVPSGHPHITDGHCLEIDNKHNAILNYKYSTPVNNRPMFDVVKELMTNIR